MPSSNPAPDAVVRPVRPEDLPQIREIYAHHVLHGTASWEVDPPDMEEMRKRCQTLLDAGYPYLVAVDGETVLGYAYAGAYRPRPAYRFTVENSIYLRHDITGRGLAAPLLQALIDACTAIGKRQMIAVIGDSNHRPSIEFHRRMGFSDVGIVRNVGWKFGRWLDQVLMQRPLGPGADSPAE